VQTLTAAALNKRKKLSSMTPKKIAVMMNIECTYRLLTKVMGHWVNPKETDERIELPNSILQTKINELMK